MSASGIARSILVSAGLALLSPLASAASTLAPPKLLLAADQEQTGGACSVDTPTIRSSSEGQLYAIVSACIAAPDGKGGGQQAQAKLVTRFLEENRTGAALTALVTALSDEGNTAATGMLGQLYLDGVGTLRNVPQGLALLRKAAADNPSASQRLLKFYLDRRDLRAASGVLVAGLKSFGLDRDIEPQAAAMVAMPIDDATRTAIEHSAASSATCCLDTARALAKYYEDTRADPAKARYWYDQAEAKGDPAATEWLNADFLRDSSQALAIMRDAGLEGPLDAAEADGAPTEKVIARWQRMRSRETTGTLDPGTVRDLRFVRSRLSKVAATGPLSGIGMLYGGPARSTASVVGDDRCLVVGAAHHMRSMRDARFALYLRPSPGTPAGSAFVSPEGVAFAEKRDVRILAYGNIGSSSNWIPDELVGSDWGIGRMTPCADADVVPLRMMAPEPPGEASTYDEDARMYTLGYAGYLDPGKITSFRCAPEGSSNGMLYLTSACSMHGMSGGPLLNGDPADPRTAIIGLDSEGEMKSEGVGASVYAQADQAAVVLNRIRRYDATRPDTGPLRADLRSLGYAVAPAGEPDDADLYEALRLFSLKYVENARKSAHRYSFMLPDGIMAEMVSFVAHPHARPKRVDITGDWCVDDKTYTIGRSSAGAYTLGAGDNVLLAKAVRTDFGPLVELSGVRPSTVGDGKKVVWTFQRLDDGRLAEVNVENRGDGGDWAQSPGWEELARCPAR